MGLLWRLFSLGSGGRAKENRRSGAGVRRRTGVLLVAGLLLDRPDWALLARAMDKPVTHAALLEDGTTSCTQQLGRKVLLPEIVPALAHALRNATNGAGYTQPRLVPDQ